MPNKKPSHSPYGVKEEWEGSATMTVEEWVTQELRSAPDLSQEGRNTLRLLLGVQVEG